MLPETYKEAGKWALYMMKGRSRGKRSAFSGYCRQYEKRGKLTGKDFDDMSLIHRYQSNGYNIVLDINSGCIHLVDSVTYEVLPYMEEGLSSEEITEKLKDRFSG